MNKFLLIDEKGRRIYGTPYGIRTGFRLTEPVTDQFIYYPVHDDNGKQHVKMVRLHELEFENQMRGVTIG